jgi:hypothetical protein
MDISAMDINTVNLGIIPLTDKRLAELFVIKNTSLFENRSPNLVFGWISVVGVINGTIDIEGNLKKINQNTGKEGFWIQYVARFEEAKFVFPLYKRTWAVEQVQVLDPRLLNDTLASIDKKIGDMLRRYNTETVEKLYEKGNQEMGVKSIILQNGRGLTLEYVKLFGIPTTEEIINTLARSVLTMITTVCLAWFTLTEGEKRHASAMKNYSVTETPISNVHHFLYRLYEGMYGATNALDFKIRELVQGNTQITYDTGTLYTMFRTPGNPEELYNQETILTVALVAFGCMITNKCNFSLGNSDVNLPGRLFWVDKNHKTEKNYVSKFYFTSQLVQIMDTIKPGFATGKGTVNRYYADLLFRFTNESRFAAATKRSFDINIIHHSYAHPEPPNLLLIKTKKEKQSDTKYGEKDIELMRNKREALIKELEPTEEKKQEITAEKDVEVAPTTTTTSTSTTTTTTTAAPIQQNKLYILTSDQVNLVNNLVEADKKNIDTAKRLKRSGIYVKNLRSLLPFVNLDNFVVDGYLELLQKRTDSNPKLPRCKFVSPNMYPILLSNLNDIPSLWKELEAISPGFSVKGIDIILFPIVEYGHWSLVVADRRVNAFKYFDSIRTQTGIPNGRNKLHVGVLRKFLLLLAEHTDDYDLFNADDWLHHIIQNIPRQTDNVNCGVYVCKFCECISMGEKAGEFKFTPADIPMIRNVMIYELARQMTMRGWAGPTYEGPIEVMLSNDV